MLGRFPTREKAVAQEQAILAQTSPNGIPAKPKNLRDFIVLKAKAPTLAAAASLVRKHGGIVRSQRQTADSWRFKQADRELFVDGSHYLEELEAGVFVVIATPIEQEAQSLYSNAEAEAAALFAEPKPSAFGGAFAYDLLGAGLVGPEGQGLAVEAFPCTPYGRAQFLRTGTGFWRKDHGEAFAIDKPLLKLIYRNTLIRSRPIRGDFMHWSDLAEANASQYRPAGWAKPSDLALSKWRDPQTGLAETGIFGPVAWENEAAVLIQKGLNQISPVIDWQYTLRHDVAGYAAGTYLGPTIIKFALVDEGFFWMDAVRLYKENETPSPSFLYRERL